MQLQPFRFERPPGPRRFRRKPAAMARRIGGHGGLERAPRRGVVWRARGGRRPNHGRAHRFAAALQAPPHKSRPRHMPAFPTLATHQRPPPSTLLYQPTTANSYAGRPYRTPCHSPIAWSGSKRLLPRSARRCRRDPSWTCTSRRSTWPSGAPRGGRRGTRRRRRAVARRRRGLTASRSGGGRRTERPTAMLVRTIPAVAPPAGWSSGRTPFSATSRLRVFIDDDAVPLHASSLRHCL